MGYSNKRKLAVLRKLLPPYNRTVADRAKEEVISTAAIYQWGKAAWAKGQSLPENSAEPRGLIDAIIRSDHSAGLARSRGALAW